MTDVIRKNTSNGPGPLWHLTLCSKEQKDGPCSNLCCNLSTHVCRHPLHVLSEVTVHFLEAIGLSPSCHNTWDTLPGVRESIRITKQNRMENAWEIFLVFLLRALKEDTKHFDLPHFRSKVWFSWFKGISSL